MPETILLTGGFGYIGSHTAVSLLNEGYRLVLLDNGSNSSQRVLKQIEKLTDRQCQWVNADLTDKQAVRSVFQAYRFDAVIHFAGLKAVGESTQLPLSYYRNNVYSSLVLLETMQEFGVSRLVFSSSATVYGDTKIMPITEQTSTFAVNPYAATKLAIERMLFDLNQAERNWCITSLRYFNPVGAHQSGLLGESPCGIPNNLMPYICQVGLGKLDCLHIFGNDYDTPDGTGVRDYVHVVDLARGHLKALKKLAPSPRPKIYNLGSGRGYSVLQLVEIFERVNQVKIPYKFVPKRAGDVAVCYADNRLARMELGWKAAKTIEDMCLDTWRWQQKYPNGLGN